jgi:dTMP kinase
MKGTHAPLLVCITGADGSGKSSLVRALAERLRESGKSVSVASIWDLHSDREMPRVYQSQARLMEYLAALSPMSRCFFVLHAVRAALDAAMERTPPPDVLLLDGYWYKYMAGEAVHGVSQAVIRALVQGFPVPDAIYHLSAPLDLVVLRKGRFSPYETGFEDVSVEAFRSFQERLTRHLLDLARKEPAPLAFLNSSADSPETLAARVAESLALRFGGHVRALHPSMAL